MKKENTKQSAPLSARMVEDETAERVKRRLRDAGLIVNAGLGKAVKPTSEKKDDKR
jgi:molybdate-binding protein